MTAASGRRGRSLPAERRGDRLTHPKKRHLSVIAGYVQADIDDLRGMSEKIVREMLRQAGRGESADIVELQASA